MKFVDRIDESARLKAALKGEKPSLVVVYGRRRLGKSTLIKKVLTNDDAYFLADRSEGSHQRALLAKVIAQIIPDFDNLSYPNWETLFRAANYRTNKHFTLCLDEFPYLVEQSAELPSVLQKIIDEKELKYNLVLCGSSQNMMYGLILDSTAPLYGRADEILRLTPIRLSFIGEALNLEATKAIEEYAVWGGVPRYWELRENRASLDDALWHNVLSVNGALYEEPLKLFQDDIKNIVKTSTIMSYIGTGANRLSEIAARSGEPATNLSRPLQKLINLGFLEKDIPFGVDEKNAKKSLYKIADPFMAFYYRFVVPYRSFIELGRRLPLELALGAHFCEYVSMQWEKMCREAVTGNEINGVVYGKAKRWWGTVVNEDKKLEQVEIDVVAESMDKRFLLVGECKWTEEQDEWRAEQGAKQLCAKLLRKANLLPFAKGHTIVPVLFLKTPPQIHDANVLGPDDVVRMWG